MKQPRLARLVLIQEFDYVQHFQELSRVNMALEATGADAALLTTKAILETDLGNFQAARASAEAAILLDPHMSEAYYQKGIACALAAFVRAEALPSGPGTHPSNLGSAIDLMDEARISFESAIALNPRDIESAENLAAVCWALAEGPDEPSLMALLRDTQPS